MRVTVDHDRCQGHNRCVALAPQLFDLDSELKAVVVVESVPADQEEAAQVAVSNCPERAIAIVDD